MNFLSISSQRLDSKKYPPSQRFKHQGIVLVTIQTVIVTFFEKKKKRQYNNKEEFDPGSG